MKASLFILTLLTFSTGLVAKEVLHINDGTSMAFAAYPPPQLKMPGEFVADNDKDMKIVSLKKLIDQQQRLYEEKITYLEFELKKSKERLVEKSINHDKAQALLNKRFSEESHYFKRELVAKTKTIMEYQRQLEKVKPSEEMKKLVSMNADLTIELRKAGDQMAVMNLQQANAIATKADSVEVNKNRKPASIEKSN